MRKTLSTGLKGHKVEVNVNLRKKFQPDVVVMEEEDDKMATGSNIENALKKNMTKERSLTQAVA